VKYTCVVKLKPVTGRMTAKMKALIYWIEDKKTSTEDLENIPIADRFVGSVCQAHWSGDGKEYPAKVLYISGEYFV